MDHISCTGIRLRGPNSPDLSTPGFGHSRISLNSEFPVSLDSNEMERCDKRELDSTLWIHCHGRRVFLCELLERRIFRRSKTPIRTTSYAKNLSRARKIA